MKKLSLAVLAALVATPTFAQDIEPEPSAQKVRYKFKERTEIDMDGVNVEATVTGPSMAGVFTTGPADDFNPLIKIRRDFNPEMGLSVDEIK